MTKLKINIVMLLMVVSLLPASAQVAYEHKHVQNVTREEADVFSAYEDSLAVLRQKVESGDVHLDSEARAEAHTKSMVLFTPLTFYKTPAKHLLSIEDESRGDTTLNACLDRTLMHTYIARPDLVRKREQQLKERNEIVKETPKAQQYHPDIYEEIAPVTDDFTEVPMDLYIEKPNFWTFSGDYSLQFMQNYVSSNWYKGGESNYSMIGSATIQANYNNKQKLKWENKLELKLGAQTSRGDTVHTFKVSTDLVRLTSKLGLQATKKWYYTLQVVGTTQMARQYGTNSKTVKADWMSPFTLNTSVGMDYTVEWMNKKLKGSIHLAPLAMNWKYVDRLALSKKYGIDEGDHSLLDYGSEFTVDLKWTFSDNISWKTRMYGYTTYSRTEFEWENTLVFKFNRYISSNLFLYPRFDDDAKRDNHHGYWQFKEYFSLGFNYSF